MPASQMINPGPVDVTKSKYVRLIPLDSINVHLKQGFWEQKQTINRRNSLRHGYAMLEQAGNFHNFRLAAGKTTGAYRGRNFLDSDVYKWLEAIAWELGNSPDADLLAMANEAIQLIADAQQEDGYINCYYQVAEPLARWADLDHSHELYCAGYLFQSAVAFKRALNDERLLIIACRFADHIASIFGPDLRQDTCGHPEVEMALIELFRTTGQDKYLQLAKFFIDQRGQRKMIGLGPYGPEYHQDHLPVRDVTEAVGHTVRQLYLAAGVTDLYLETGEPSLLDAMHRLYADIDSSKLYITGGLGSRFDGEAFGDPYELPSDQCYCEACSAIAFAMWNWRMLLATGNGSYADQIERELYNNIMASPSLDGKKFFYNNPLMLREARFLRLSSNPPPVEDFVPNERPEWHDVACCPTNIMRLLPTIGHYLATTDGTGIQIHQYTAADISYSLSNGDLVSLTMDTDYPWNGLIRISVTQSGSAPWALSLRQPAWCDQPEYKINGHSIATQAQNGYVRLERQWQVGDIIEVNFEMKPMLMIPNPRIDAIRASLAIQQGPIIYCIEDADQKKPFNLLDVELDPNAEMKSEWRADLLGGINMIEAGGQVIDPSPWQQQLYRSYAEKLNLPSQTIRLLAVPYYAWGNRGIGPMRIWIPKKIE